MKVLQPVDLVALIQKAIDTNTPLAESGWSRASPIEFGYRRGLRVPRPPVCEESLEGTGEILRLTVHGPFAPVRDVVWRTSGNGRELPVRGSSQFELGPLSQ